MVATGTKIIAGGAGTMIRTLSQRTNNAAPVEVATQTNLHQSQLFHIGKAILLWLELTQEGATFMEQEITGDTSIATVEEVLSSTTTDNN